MNFSNHYGWFRQQTFRQACPSQQPSLSAEQSARLGNGDTVLLQLLRNIAMFGEVLKDPRVFTALHCYSVEL